MYNVGWTVKLLMCSLFPQVIYTSAKPNSSTATPFVICWALLIKEITRNLVNNDKIIAVSDLIMKSQLQMPNKQYSELTRGCATRLSIHDLSHCQDAEFFIPSICKIFWFTEVVSSVLWTLRNHESPVCSSVVGEIWDEQTQVDRDQRE